MTVEITLELPEEITFYHGTAKEGTLVKRTVKTAEVPPQSLVHTLLYGKRDCNDRCNSIRHKAKEAGELDSYSYAATIDAYVKKYMAGEMGESTRASDAVEKHLRTIVVNLLVEHKGKSQKDARALVGKGAKAAFDAHFPDDTAMWEPSVEYATAQAQIDAEAAKRKAALKMPTIAPKPAE